MPLSDGTQDNDFIPAGGFSLYDFSSNGGESQAKPFAFQEGTQVWVRSSTAPTTKSVYCITSYGLGE